jgi:hypothetical protein
MPQYRSCRNEQNDFAGAEKSAAGIKQAAKPCVKRFATLFPLKNITFYANFDVHMQRDHFTQKKKRSEERFLKYL